MTTYSFSDKKTTKKTASEEAKEVLLTVIEWSRLVELGVISIPASRFFPKNSKLEKHMSVAPAVGEEEDAYVMCRYPVLHGSNRSLMIDIAKVISFHAVTDQGQRFLSVNPAATYVKLSEPVFNKSWFKYFLAQKEKNSVRASQLMLLLFGTAKELSTKARKGIDSRLFEPVEDKNTRLFLGTPAGGYRTSLSVITKLEKETSFMEKFREVFAEFDLKNKLEKLRCLPNDNPVLSIDSGFYPTFWERMSQLNDEHCKKHIDFRALLVFWHYAGMAQAECNINPLFLKKDIETLRKYLKKPDVINRLIFELGRFIPLQQITYWWYTSMEAGKNVAVALEGLKVNSFSPDKHPRTRKSPKTRTNTPKLEQLTLLE